MAARTKEALAEALITLSQKKSLEKITADDIQVEINVSGLSVRARSSQSIEVSNISIVNEGINDCWIYGKYDAVISVASK